METYFKSDFLIYNSQSYLEMVGYDEEEELPTDPIESFRIIRRLYSDYSNWVWYLEQQPWESKGPVRPKKMF